MPPPELVRPEPAAPKPQGALLPILFLAFLAAVAGSSLLFLTQGWIRGVLLIGAAVVCLPLVHYLTWGWWLGKLLQIGRAHV